MAENQMEGVVFFVYVFLMVVGSDNYYNFIIKDNLAEKLMEDGGAITPNLCFIHVLLQLCCLYLFYLFFHTYYLYKVYTIKLSIVCFCLFAFFLISE